VYPRSAVLDPNLRTCGSMPNSIPYEPGPDFGSRLDAGLFLVNVDRRTTTTTAKITATTTATTTTAAAAAVKGRIPLDAVQH
tara:strand:+ start:259 stop:504 length:246 start_codon:yes stop_codon:yes gene_type:complete